MFHMLSCFNLNSKNSVAEFQASLEAFHEYLKANDLVCSVGPLGRRCSDTPMDTDDERALAYYFIMSFRDREHCDEAYEFIDRNSASHASHVELIAKVKDAVFICWEDI